MESIQPHLADIWLAIIGFFLLYYAVTDGFDLGVGIISIFSRNDAERGVLMASIENTWHDHQTWLLLLGGMLFGAFPRFYSIVLSSLYIPILVMLFGLIFRGVAFEFRALSHRKLLWGLSFGFGSLLVSLAQGFALGGLFGGLTVQQGKFEGGAWGWLSPYSTLVAAGLISGYVMLGANYLILKTNGDVRKRSRRYSLAASLCTLFVSVCVHAWTTAKYPRMAAKWLASPEGYFMAGFLALTVIAFVMFFRSLRKGPDYGPLVWNALIILFSFVDVSIGMYPDMIPNFASAPMTVHEAAASPGTLTFMLAATVILLPVILAYTAYKNHVFRGKVRESDDGIECKP